MVVVNSVDSSRCSLEYPTFNVLCIFTMSGALVVMEMAAVATVVAPCRSNRSSPYRLFSFCEIVCALESIAANTITYNLFAIIFREPFCFSVLI